MLHLPYILNIIIFAPVCWMMYSVVDRKDALKRKAVGSHEMAVGLTLVGLIILVASIAGLFWQLALIPMLIIQILYKALFLVLVAYPLWRAGGVKAIPLKVTLFFLFVVVTYPFAIWAMYAEMALL